MDSMSERYRRAAKRSKTRVLDEVCAATGFHRKYAIGRINLIETCRPLKTIVHRKRKRFYGREVLTVVEEVWKEAGCPYYQQFEMLGQLVRNQRVGGSIPLAGFIDSQIRDLAGRFRSSRLSSGRKPEAFPRGNRED